jgi:hypothetical protein
MAVDERIMAAIADDEDTNSQVNETVEQETTPAEEPKVEAPVEQPVEQPVPVEKTYSQSDWDKMVYSLKRQMR